MTAHIFFLLFFRAWALRAWWRMSANRAPLLLPYAFEAVLIAILFSLGRSDLLWIEQVAAALVISLIHFRTIVATIEPQPKAVSSVAASLKPRRLLDATSVPFEIALALLTLGALAASGWSARAAVCLYLQAGLLLLKYSVIHWRMRLPAERTGDFLRYFDAMIRAFTTTADCLRVFFALVIVASESLLLAAGCVTAAVLLWGIRRQDAIGRAVRPEELAVAPDAPFDHSRFHLAGLLYCDSDHPAALIEDPPGPFWFALNLGDRRTRAWLAYAAGLALLTIVVR